MVRSRFMTLVATHRDSTNRLLLRVVIKKNTTVLAMTALRMAL